MRILVTGGAGFIGSHVVDALVERGHGVRVLDSFVPQVHTEGRPDHLHPSADLVAGEVTDPDVVARALDGVDAVCHLAAEVGVGQSMYEITRYVRANSLGAAVLLEAITQSHRSVRRLVVASSMSIYGEGLYACRTCAREVTPQLRTSAQLASRQWEMLCRTCGGQLVPVPTPESKPLYPSSVYAITKQDHEQLFLVVGKAYDIPTTALRYFNVYGPRQSLSNPYTGAAAIFCSRLLNGQGPVLFEDGQQTRDFVHVKDIVQATVLALESEDPTSQAMNVGTGRSTSILALAQMLATGLGVDVDMEMTGMYREGDIRHCVADISTANERLGYQPEVSLSEGLVDLLDWVRFQKSQDAVALATTELIERGLVR